MPVNSKLIMNLLAISVVQPVRLSLVINIATIIALFYFGIL